MQILRLPAHPLFALFAIQIVLAYEWLSAGWGKIHGGQFVPNIGKSLSRFENGNPHEWYAGSVLEIAKNYPFAFGTLVQWGELLTGIGLFTAVVLFVVSKQPSFKRLARFIGIAALFGGAFMNANFSLAAGWTSPSTGGLNALMFWIQIILLVAWAALPRAAKSISRR